MGTRGILITCSAAAALFAPLSASAQNVVLPTINVGTWTRLNSGMAGTSTSVITAADIERSPAQSLPDILAQQTGVQIQHLFSGTNGSRDTVDLRGFGAFASSNVLILVNGRRYQDFDLQGFDFSSIPLNSIERIEITRGNSATVLYGDGAVGGVINIVTKTGASPAAVNRGEVLAGSYIYREGRLSLGGVAGPWSTALFGNAISADGYRTNNRLNQTNINANLNYTGVGGGGYLTIAGDRQHQGLPGALPNVSSIFAGPFSLATPADSNTPLDWGDKQGFNVATGVTATLTPGVDLIVDGSVRRKFQQAQFYNYNNTPFGTFDLTTAVPGNYVNTVMTTTSLTPRLDITHGLFGVPNRLLTGFDYYNTQYNSNRPPSPGTPAVHSYDIRQTTLALYGMNTTTVRPDLDFSLGGRVQRNNVRAMDAYNPLVDPNAFFYAGNPAAPPLDKSETQYAVHVGLDYRVLPSLTVFARAARAFRLGNADERVGAGNPFGIIVPANFDLKTQTSHDIEGGFRVNAGRFNFESTAYVMQLRNEIHFLPALGFDTNLDPTQRVGWENTATYQWTDVLRLRAGAAYVNATFREGIYAGNEVPLISRWTGNAGFSWNIVDKRLVLDMTGRFFSSRRMDNDQPNVQPVIPGKATLDIKIGGQADHLFWSFAVLNAFDSKFFDYAIASGGLPAGAFFPATPPTLGAYNAYPLAGRTFMMQAGATF